MPELPRNSFTGQTATRLGRVSLNPRGEYADGETYDRLDIVQYNGSGWICLKDSTIGVTPVEGENWMRFADNGGAATVEAAQEYAEQAKASQTAAGESAAQAQTAQEAAETARDEATTASTTAEEKATEAAESAQSAKDYSGKPPVIDEDTGNWKTWDAESGDYTDTGKPARGEQGIQGPPGKDGEGTGDMMAADYDPNGHKQDIFAYVDNAVENVKLPDNLIVGEDEELPPVELALNADTLGGFGPEHYATEESVEKKADQSALTDGLAEKQDKLTGVSGQIVGFDETGNAVAQEVPRSSSAYVHRFDSVDWKQVSEQEEYTITVNSDTHKMAGSIVSCIAMVKDTNSYLQTAFGAVQTYATIDDGNVITIHAKDAYTGLAILTAYE